MEELEGLLRATFRAHEHETPDVAGPAVTGLASAARSGHARRTARRRQLTAVGTVGVLAVGASSALAVTRHGSGAAAGPAAVTPVTQAATPTGAATPADGGSTPVLITGAAPLPDSQSAPWSSRGLELRVPKAWKANQLRCGTPTESTVVIGPGGSELCMVSAKPVDVVEFGTASFVDIQPQPQLRPTTLGGHAAFTGSALLGDGRSATAVIVPDLDVSVTVMSRHPELVGSILASARIVDQDANGCASRIVSVEPTGTPARPEAQAVMVPGKPVKVVVCHYTPAHPAGGTVSDVFPALARGMEIPATNVAALATVLNTLKPGLASDASTGCTPAAQDGYLFHFTYASGAPVDVYLHTYNCDHEGFSNGAVSGFISTKFMNSLTLFSLAQGFSASQAAIK